MTLPQLSILQIFYYKGGNPPKQFTQKSSFGLRYELNELEINGKRMFLRLDRDL